MALGGDAPAGLLMDRIYRRQRHLYDAPRKHYLLGRDRLIAELEPPEGGAVLEIGCGTGTTALRLAHRVRRLHATDVSSQMVAIAQEKLAVTPMAQLDFAVLDAAGAAQQAPQAYDVVLAFNVLHLLPDLDGGLDAVWQALRPGGFFISKTPCVAEMNPLIPWVALPLARALGLAPPVHCFQGPTLEAAIARHGFEVLAVERHATKRRDVRPYIVARKPHQAATVADPETAPH